MIFASPRRFGLAGDVIAWSDTPEIAKPGYVDGFTELYRRIFSESSPILDAEEPVIEAQVERACWWNRGMVG